MAIYHLTFLDWARQAITSSGIEHFPDWPEHASPDDFALWLFELSPVSLDTYGLANALTNYLDAVLEAGKPLGQLASAESIDNVRIDGNFCFARLADAVYEIRASPGGDSTMQSIGQLATSTRPTELFLELAAPVKRSVAEALHVLRSMAEAFDTTWIPPYQPGLSEISDFLVREHCWRLDEVIGQQKPWDGTCMPHFAEAMALVRVATEPSLRNECIRLMGS